eukprot:620137-Alexandrium_andersonii.AAC.1
MARDQRQPRTTSHCCFLLRTAVPLPRAAEYCRVLPRTTAYYCVYRKVPCTTACCHVLPRPAAHHR